MGDLYLQDLLKVFKSVMDAGGEMGKLIEKPKYKDTTWVDRFRRQGQAIEDQARVGLALRPLPIFNNLHREAESVLRHYQRAGEFLRQACDVLGTPSMLDLLQSASFQLDDGNSRIGRIVDQANKFLKTGIGG